MCLEATNALLNLASNTVRVLLIKDGGLSAVCVSTFTRLYHLFLRMWMLKSSFSPHSVTLACEIGIQYI